MEDYLGLKSFALSFLDFYIPDFIILMMVLWAYGFVSPSGFVRTVRPAADVPDSVACELHLLVRETQPHPQ